MLDSKHKHNVTQGRYLEAMYHMPGWKDVFIPRLNKALELAQRDVFDGRINEKTAKERIAYYNGIKAVLNLIKLTEKEKEQGLAYFDKLGVNI